MPFTTGNKTKSTFLVGPEAHKLMYEFQSTEGIHVGQPCKMHADGDKVVPCVADEPEANIVGISIHPGKSAYGDYVVLATRGYAIIYAQASDAVTPGPVQYDGYDATTEYSKVKDLAAVVTPAEAAPLPGSLQFGWALEPAAEAGDIIRVLVKD